MKVSVIVPVYNAGETIERCVDSLIGQTLESMEIILVDDGSTDNSLVLLRQYQQKNPTLVRVIALANNRGAGGARNAGMNAATGDYIGFVDSDDYVDIHMYEHLYQEAMAGDWDVVDSAIYNTRTKLAQIAVNDDLTGEFLLEKRQQLVAIGGYTVTKLYKRDYLIQNQIIFREHVKLEDADFLMKIYMTAPRIGNRMEVLYYYNEAGTGDSWSVSRLSEKNYGYITQTMTAVHQLLEDREDRENWREVLEAAMTRLYASAIHCCIRDDGAMDEVDLKRLYAVRQLRRDYIKGAYSNSYVQKNLSQEEITLMEYVDRL